MRMHLRPLLLVVLFVSFLFLGMDTARSGLSATPTDASRISPAVTTSGIVFVGQDHVDFRQQFTSGNPTDYTYHRLYRDGTRIADLSPAETLFFRDTAVVGGGTYTYDYCWNHTVYGTHCWSDNGLARTVTVGRIWGTLFADTVWQGGTYALASSAEIYVADGATLEIGASAVVTSQRRTISDRSPSASLQDGIIQIKGATVHNTSLTLHNSQSVVQESTLATGSATQLLTHTLFSDNTVSGMVTLGSPLLPSAPTVTVMGNTFHEGSLLHTDGGSSATVQDNQFWGGQLTFGRAGALLVEQNEFRFGGESRARGGILAASTQASCADLTVRGNRFESATHNLYGVSPGGACPTTIEYNHFFGAPELSAGMAVFAGTGSALLLRGNVISGWPTGLAISGSSVVTATNNGFVGNGQGIQVAGQSAERPDAYLADNCIAGQRLSGLNISAGSGTIDARRNWWGSASGPRWTANPDGTGDSITQSGGDAQIVVEPWLGSNNCSGLEWTANDLGVVGMEALQVIQTRKNDVPLVAGRPTLVRIYVESATGTLDKVDARLTGYRFGQRLGDLAPERVITADTIGTIDEMRASLDKSLNFTLPAEWTTQFLTLVATVNPQQAISETILDNNVTTRTLQFFETSPLRVAYQPIRYQPYGAGPVLVPNATVAEAVNQMLRQTLPVTKVESVLLPPSLWTLPLSHSNEFTELYRSLALFTGLSLKLKLWNSLQPAEAQVDRIIGILPDAARQETYGYIPFSESAAYARGDDQALLFWLGYTFGLRRTPEICLTNPGEIDHTDWPYENSTIQQPGYNAKTGSLIPATTLDWMSGCEPAWISPYHYEKLLSVFLKETSDRRQTITATATDQVIVSGYIDAQQGVTLLPLWQVTARTPIQNGPAGETYCATMEDDQGTLVASHCFDGAELEGDSGEQGAISFVIALTWIPSADRITIQSGQQVLRQIQSSDHPPTVTLETATVQTDQRLVLGWSGEDVDGESLVYSLFYSPDDGRSWQPLLVNTTQTQAEISLAGLRPSQQARLRVMVSDGFHTASTESAPLAVTDVGPVVAITSPADGLFAQAPITLTGHAYTWSGTFHPDGALTWTSSLDGELGTGGVLPGVALRDGEHLIQLTATGPDMVTGRAAITLHIGEQSGFHVYMPSLFR